MERSSGEVTQVTERAERQLGRVKYPTYILYCTLQAETTSHAALPLGPFVCSGADFKVSNLFLYFPNADKDVGL